MSDLNALNEQINAIANGVGSMSAVPDQTFDNFLQLISETYEVVQLDANIDTNATANRLNLSTKFVAIANKGFKEYSQNLLEELGLAAGEGKLGKFSVRTRVNIFGLQQGFKPLLSPFTGNKVQTRDSLGREWYLLRENDDFCFVSELSQPMTFMGVEGLWVFPSRKLIVWLNNGYGSEDIKRHVASFYSLLCRHADGISRYLGSDTRRLGLTDFHCPHVCHNFWNVMAGWANVLEYSGMCPDLILQYGNQNFYGLVEDLFPDKIDIDTCSIADDEDAFLKAVLEKDALVFCVKDEFISKSFTSRVLKHAYSRVSNEFLDEVKAFKDRSRPFVLVTIRLDNRAWIDQTEGFILATKDLQKKYPNMGVMLDGLSSDSVKGWTTGWMSLEAELNVARDIEAGLDGVVPVIFGVARTFYESIVLSDFVDAFVAPIGSGMTIYKWITNKPGVAFSNRTALDPVNIWHPLRVWDHYCEEIQPASYMPMEMVTDIEDARDHVSRANFSMNWSDLSQQVDLLFSQRFPDYRTAMS